VAYFHITPALPSRGRELKALTDANLYLGRHTRRRHSPRRINHGRLTSPDTPPSVPGPENTSSFRDHQLSTSRRERGRGGGKASGYLPAYFAPAPALPHQWEGYMAKNSCHLNLNAPPSGVENRPVDIPNHVPSLELFEKTVFFRYAPPVQVTFRGIFQPLARRFDT